MTSSPFVCILLLLVCITPITSLGFYTDGDLFLSFLGGFASTTLITEIIEDDPCSSKDCDTGKCSVFSEQEESKAICLCKAGYCGDNCEPSGALTGLNCVNGQCVTPGAICVDGKCRCDCLHTFIPNTLAVRDFRSLCREDCPEGLSNTFARVRNALINIDFRKQTVGATSVEDCESECAQETEFECYSVTSVELGPASFRCNLHEVRKDDPTIYQTNFRPQLTYSERLCNPSTKAWYDQYKKYS